MEILVLYREIYKKDSKGKTRVWYAEQEADSYRMWDGILGGKVKCSEWKLALPTNIGRSNERDGTAQAIFEIEAQYKKKLEKDYHESLEDIETGSHIFEVMLAETYKAKPKDVFVSGFAQPKLDGFRCIVDKNGMWSRAGKPFVSCPHIMESLVPLFDKFPVLKLDGELYNHNLQDDFNEIQSLITTKSDKSLTPEHYEQTRSLVQYHVYDIPSFPFRFSERVTFLRDLIASLGEQSVIKLVQTTQVHTEEQYDYDHFSWVEQGYEGSIWRSDSLYENRRSKGLLKRKDFDEEEFEVVEIQEGKGNWAGAAKRVICWLPNADRSLGPTEDNTFEAGLRGTRERNKKLLYENHDIVTIRFFGWTPSDIPKPRFGVATKWHGEKREY